MKHPEPQAIRSAMALLEVHALRNHGVIMYEGAIYEHAKCGTIACHGGWYLFAKRGDKLTAIPHSSQRKLYRFANRAAEFNEGADLLAKDLGFESKWTLMDWASAHPELWGNIHGSCMFGHQRALGAEEAGEILSLRTIIDHWYGVADRIEALEGNKDVPHRHELRAAPDAESHSQGNVSAEALCPA